MNAVAILTAAGSGSRLGSALPKALVTVGGEPLVLHAARALVTVADRLVVTAPAGMEQQVTEALAEIPQAEVVTGGCTRQASVAAGLARLSDRDPGTVVLVHDAARPFAPPALVRRVVDAVQAGHSAVVPGLPVTDTVKQVQPGTDPARVLATVDRAALRAVQTPQGFTLEVLRRAHEAGAARAGDEATAATDDAALVEALGLPVHVVAGSAEARKITTAADLAAVTSTPTAPPPVDPAPAGAMPRTGVGADVHAYAPEGSDRPMWLAGLHWPDQTGLAGHSDGDAVAHAAADALLSAAGLGDLGSVIGIDDPAWAGASGTAILTEVAARVRQAGYRIGNVGVQVVGVRPRLATRRAEAERVLSAACGAPVSVAGTTSDGLGFTGRADGVAAVAVALVLAHPAPAAESG